MAEDILLVEHLGDTLRVVINRHDKRNALSLELLDRIGSTFAQHACVPDDGDAGHRCCRQGSRPGAHDDEDVQPGVVEVFGPRVSELTAAGIQKITATPGKGARSIAVQSPWGNSYFGWPKDVKPVFRQTAWSWSSARASW